MLAFCASLVLLPSPNLLTETATEIAPFRFSITRPYFKDFAYTLSVAERLGIQLPNEQQKNLEWLRDFNRKVGVRGGVEYLDGAEMREASCSSVASLKEFRSQVVSHSQRLNRKITWLSKTAARLDPPDELLGRMPSFWYRYHSKVMIGGTEESVLRLDVRDVSGWINSARTAHSFTIIRPTVLTADYRQLLATSIRHGLNVARQRRNEESVHTHLYRSLKASIIESNVDAVLNDVDELSVVSRWPSSHDAKRSTANFRVKFSKDSPTSRQVQELSIRRPVFAVPAEIIDTAVFSLEIHAKLPKLSGYYPVGPGRELAQLLAAFVARAQFDGAVVVPAGEDRISCVSVFSHSSSQAQPVSAETLLSDFDTPVLRELNDLAIACEVGRKKLRLSISETPDLSEADKIVRRARNNERRSLATLHADLSKWPRRTNANSKSNQFLQSLERMYDVWSHANVNREQVAANRRLTQKMDPKVRSEAARLLTEQMEFRPLGDDFRSALPKADLAGSWKIEARLTTKNRGTVLEGEISLGRSLHEVLVARSLLAGLRQKQGLGTNRASNK
jgi:hypothetical protein